MGSCHATAIVPAMSNPVPETPGARIEAIDVVRGFALLGILLLNVLAFGLPIGAYTNPTVDGALDGVDFGVFAVVELLFEGAMRVLFSMLFGAGVVILATGERARGAAIYYRRQLLLLVIGLLDAFVLLWTGDILVSYALAGLILYLCRDWQPKTLFAAAALVFAYLAAVYGGIFVSLSILPEQAEKIQARLVAGAEISADDRALLADWTELRHTFEPPAHVLAREALKFQGDYPEAFAANAAEVIELYAVALPFVMFWDVLGCMLLGMALFKNGVLGGRRALRFYTLLAVAGFAVGLAVNAFELTMKVRSGYALAWVSGVPTISYDVGRVAMALGFLALVTIACLRGWMDGLRRGLAAAGRMALSNYILQSLFGLAIFHNLGLGLWNELARHQLYLVVCGEWAVMIWFSLWWLRRYRFGPLEWLWRSLTYGRIQPMMAHRQAS